MTAQSNDDKFQSILDNYINGNRGDARKGFEALSSNEKHNFKGWLKTYREEVGFGEHVADLLFFLLFA